MCKFIVASFLAVCLAGCDSVLLQSGDYNVDILYTEDNWPASRLGEHTAAVWHIVEVAEHSWAMSVVDTSTQDLPGRDTDGHIIVHNETESTRFHVDIDPYSDAQGFFALGCIHVLHDDVVLYTTCGEMRGEFAQ
jgi:hypothetical protein